VTRAASARRLCSIRRGRETVGGGSSAVDPVAHEDSRIRREQREGTPAAAGHRGPASDVVTLLYIRS
jgi:hypothetical protein